MAKEQGWTSQIQFLLSDFNTRLRNFEEKNRIIRERILLLGENLISLKQETEDEIKELKKQTNEIQKDLGKIKSIMENLLAETDKFVKKDEILLIERMLKDFQPLEFVREKDIEKIMQRKLNKNIKTKKTKK
jgi:esterase/lipase